MLSNQLKDDLLQIEAETFEILDLTEIGADLATVPAAEDGWCSSSCSCSSCCSCSTSSCCSTSTSSCG
ncbi:hypothetical protein O7627_22770 [Solwaraspora sp. WMMD1047]|uniref:hypothetical protein n=1 Tax=Solwaraspora sp. WMMD1047 TaxID=3016102 RepID=UPI0024165D80|nr:hypothetical protein [Solwaraspora sp. WMMD1047]MDG4832109.1 hypothetical protein [Solwaraspora sp. WMMD1047]